MARRPLRTFTGPNLTGQQQLSFQPTIVRRDLEVARVEQITPRYRRVVLSGAALDDGFPFLRFSCNDHVKAYFPDPSTGQIVAYREIGDDQWEVDSEAGRPIRRDYTPRAFDAEAAELTLDFVIHEHGVAGRWARDARVGDPLTIMGPRANWLLPENYGHYLALGDETALPAISRLIEEAPRGSRVTAMVEIADADEEQHLVPGEDVELDLHWIRRETAPVDAGHLGPLETGLHRIGLPAPLEELYVFAAGEAGAMKPIRRHLRRELTLPKQQLAVDGYWKRGVTDHDHHTNDFDDED